MKLLSMSLALFFCSVLAIITDATPSGPEEDAEHKCRVFETFDKVVRGENNIRAVAISNEWKLSCDDFSCLEDFLCPTADAVAAICLAKKPYENPAVIKNYCRPLFSILGRSRRDECNIFCANYVSAAKGDCCDIDCSLPSDAPSMLPTSGPSAHVYPRE